MPLNRVYLLTPPGIAALATLRIAGLSVPQFLAQHFSKAVANGRAVHGELRDGARIIDDPVVVLVAPDCADITLHGGSWVVQSAIELAKSAGFQWSEESPAMHDAADALEAEMLDALPKARTELALKILLAQPAAWARLIAESQDGTNVREQLQSTLTDRTLETLLRLPRVAIVGIPNAGKSSLANQLFAQERAITADVPGTTRDWVGEIANLDGLAVMLVDTPGIRQTADPIEAAAIARSADQITAADLIVLVLDAAQPLEMQQELLDRFPTALRVLNKYDHLSSWAPIYERSSLSSSAPGTPGQDRGGGLRCDDEAARSDALPAKAPTPALSRSTRGGGQRQWDPIVSVIPTVATTGAGMPELIAEIHRRLGCIDLTPHRPRCWTSRQRAIVERALSAPRALGELAKSI